MNSHMERYHRAWSLLQKLLTLGDVGPHIQMHLVHQSGSSPYPKVFNGGFSAQTELIKSLATSDQFKEVRGWKNPSPLITWSILLATSPPPQAFSKSHLINITRDIFITLITQEILRLYGLCSETGMKMSYYKSQYHICLDGIKALRLRAIL